MSTSLIDTVVTERDPSLLNDGRVNLIENGTPDTRMNLTAHHTIGPFRALARLNHWGDYYDNEAGGSFTDATILDLEVGYNFNGNIDVTLGGRNVMNERGCSTNSCGVTPPGVLGLRWSQFTPFGFNGMFLYGKVSYTME